MCNEYCENKYSVEYTTVTNLDKSTHAMVTVDISNRQLIEKNKFQDLGLLKVILILQTF